MYGCSVSACKEWRCYLEGVPSTCHRDHAPLCNIHSHTYHADKQGGWNFWQAFGQMWFVYKAGCVPADILSRPPHELLPVQLDFGQGNGGTSAVPLALLSSHFVGSGCRSDLAPYPRGLTNSGNLYMLEGVQPGRGLPVPRSTTGLNTFARDPQPRTTCRPTRADEELTRIPIHNCQPCQTSAASTTAVRS
jgi:hypothetical protein